MATETPKPKVDLSEDRFVAAEGGFSGANGPVVEGHVEYSDTHMTISIPLAQFNYAQSRPTSKATRRQFVIRGDVDPKEGLPGYVGLSNGSSLGVRFSNPTLNLFFGREKA